LAFGFSGGLWRAGSRPATKLVFGSFCRLADCRAFERLLAGFGAEGFTGLRSVVDIRLLLVPAPAKGQQRDCQQPEWNDQAHIPSRFSGGWGGNRSLGD
jgi:hypothetical protein